MNGYQWDHRPDKSFLSDGPHIKAIVRPDAAGAWLIDWWTPFLSAHCGHELIGCSSRDAGVMFCDLKLCTPATAPDETI